MKTKLSGRKVLLFAVLFLTATVSLGTSVATFAEWADFMQWLFAAYVVGNVGQKFVEPKEFQYYKKAQKTEGPPQDERG